MRSPRLAGVHATVRCVDRRCVLRPKNPSPKHDPKVPAENTPIANVGPETRADQTRTGSSPTRGPRAGPDRRWCFKPVSAGATRQGTHPGNQFGVVLSEVMFQSGTRDVHGQCSSVFKGFFKLKSNSTRVADTNLTVFTHPKQVLASVIVIAHPDPIFREGLRAHLQIEPLQSTHLSIQTRNHPQWHRNLTLLIAPLQLLSNNPKQCPVLALVQPDQVQANLFDRCDDFLRLPYDPLELRARATKLLILKDHRVPLREVVEIGDVRLDPNAQRTWFQGSELELTRREFELLETLMLNAGRVVHKDELLRIAWGEHFAGKVRTVDQHVLQVRHHLHDHAKGSK